MNRRDFLGGIARTGFGSALLGIFGTQARSEVDAKPSAAADGLAKAIAEQRMAITFDGRQFSGPGYEWLLARGAAAQAFLLGEEHGIAENPKLAAALFAAFVPHGYRKLAIETSPPIAAAMEESILRGGLRSLEQFVTTPGSQAVFFGLREEAEWLAAARAAVHRREPLLWGLDYELSSDRYLIRKLKAKSKPTAAARALAALEAASNASWQRYFETRDPRFIFSFAGDPAPPDAVRRAWLGADESTRIILDTLAETQEVNKLWNAGKGYESNLRRVALMRSNLVRHWRAEDKRDPDFRLFMKFGPNHMFRGLNTLDMFDIGSLVPELVAARGSNSFHLMVLPGPGSQTANFDPTRFLYAPGSRDEYGKGMELFNSALLPGGFTLFDTAPLRPLASSSAGDLPPQLTKVIHGFDAVLVMAGSHPSTNI